MVRQIEGSQAGRIEAGRAAGDAAGRVDFRRRVGPPGDPDFIAARRRRGPVKGVLQLHVRRLPGCAVGRGTLCLGVHVDSSGLGSMSHEWRRDRQQEYQFRDRRVHGRVFSSEWGLSRFQRHHQDRRENSPRLKNAAQQYHQRCSGAACRRVFTRIRERERLHRHYASAPRSSWLAPRAGEWPARLRRPIHEDAVGALVSGCHRFGRVWWALGAAACLLVLVAAFVSCRLPPFCSRADRTAACRQAMGTSTRYRRALRATFYQGVHRRRRFDYITDFDGDCRRRCQPAGRAPRTAGWRDRVCGKRSAPIAERPTPRNAALDDIIGSSRAGNMATSLPEAGSRVLTDASRRARRVCCHKCRRE